MEEGDFLPYLAPHQGNAQLSFIRGNHALEINARYVSSMRVEAGQASPEPSHATDALTVLDVMYRYQVSEECTAYVGVNNALNTTAVVAMRPAGLRPNMPRLLRAGISITL